MEKAPLVIFLHGFKGFKDWGQWPLMAKEMSNEKVSILRMNFSHNGTTPETPKDFSDLDAFGENTFSKEILDLREVVNWVKTNLSSKVDMDNIHILAHSRGGAIGLIALNEFEEIKSLVTLSGVGNLVRFSDQELEFWKRNEVLYIPNARTNQQMPLKYSLAQDYLDNESRYAPMSVVQKITKPYLIIHAEMDETVSLKEAEELHKNGITTSFEIIKDGNHSFGGGHPYLSSELPSQTKQAMELALNFIK